MSDDYDLFSHLFSYCPDTGELRWKNTTSLKRLNGKLAGYVNSGDGYICVMVGLKNYKAHRIAWLLTHGKWPDGEIDHIDHNRTNNKITNLREATQVENSRNLSLSKKNTSGHVGVCWHKYEKKWYAYITVDGKQINLGLHNFIHDAVSARKKAQQELGFHGNHGK